MVLNNVILSTPIVCIVLVIININICASLFSRQLLSETVLILKINADIIIVLIILFINYNWVVTRWQSLFYMYTKYEIGY